jgi:di/tricarboxylate transporter
VTVLAAVVVVLTLVAMASGKVPAVLALGTALAFAGITGITPVSELTAGLSNGGVITVACMLVLAKGVVQTGVVTRVTWKLLSTVESASQAFRRLVVPIGVASALINTTPIVAMLVPAAKELQQTKGIPARELLLPIAHATTLAGSVTLIGTSSNLLIAGLAAPAGVQMSMLSFAPIALPVALVGWVVLAVTARLLRGEAPVSATTLEWRVEIPVGEKANALGRLPSALGVDTTQEYSLAAIQRWGQDLDPTMAVEAGDVLVYRATERGVRALWGSPRFGLAATRLYAASVGPGEHGTLDDLEEHGDLRVVAAQTDRPLRETRAMPGETCFVTAGSPEVLTGHGDLTIWQDVAGRVPQPGKTWIALSILAGVVVSASFGLLAVELAAFAGAILMVLTRVITPTSAARALDWNVLFVLAGSVGLGAIVVSSGLADLLADAIATISAGSATLVVVVFALTTALLTNITTNAAAASILTPVAIGIAATQGLNAVMLLALIGTCISFTLINPFSHQSNLMVLKPGGYSNREFARFGIPLLIVCVITVCIVGVLLIA